MQIQLCHVSVCPFVCVCVCVNVRELVRQEKPRVSCPPPALSALLLFAVVLFISFIVSFILRPHLVRFIFFSLQSGRARDGSLEVIAAHFCSRFK